MIYTESKLYAEQSVKLDNSIFCLLQNIEYHYRITTNEKQLLSIGGKVLTFFNYCRH